MLDGARRFSTHPRAELLSAWALRDHVDPTIARTTDLLVDISPFDVPFVVRATEPIAPLVSRREACVVASIDGHATVEAISDRAGLPSGEVLGLLCSLCARGILGLVRAARLADR